MKYLLPLFTISCLFGTATVFAQTKIKDNTVTGTSSLPNNAAILELESNNKGLLLPRVALTTTTTWGLTGTAVIGMTVYNTSATINSSNPASPIRPGGKGSYYWDGTGWVAMAYTSAASIPTLYTADGTVTSERTVTLNNDLHFYNPNPTTGGYYEFFSSNGPQFSLSSNSTTGTS